MAEVKKQERDFTPEVEALVPEAEKLAKDGRLEAALDKLYALEKQTRNGSDLPSTRTLALTASRLAYDARDYDLLNSGVQTLSKKHGQLKGAIQAMVEQILEWVPEVKGRDGVDRWLELLDTVRVVTEGKIFLETPRARATLLLAHHQEESAGTATSPESKQEFVQKASDLLSELQVETYSSMERREKTEFILEQMRLSIEIARLKDARPGKDGISDGDSDWVKVRVGGRKVNESFLKDEKNEDLKLKYYDLMIQHALHQGAYLDVAKHYYKVWETPSIKAEETERGRQALESIVYYIILSPHDNEQSDMLHHLSIDPALSKLELHSNLIKCFTTSELMRWPGIESIYGPTLKTTIVFGDGGEKRWEDLHTRVIEHNVRVIAAYYAHITIPRLTSLLDMTVQQTEETISRLVVSGTIWARIDRTAGIVNFRSKRSAEEVMNGWSSDMQRLLGLTEKCWMTMNAALASQSRR